MRQPRVRLSIRCLMVFVAMAALAISLRIRRERFSRLARQYAAIASWEPTCNLPPEPGTEAFLRWTKSRERDRAGRESFLRQSRKYERAGRYPWLPVAPDEFEPFPSLPENWREIVSDSRFLNESD